jgi:hypothetical protein
VDRAAVGADVLRRLGRAEEPVELRREAGAAAVEVREALEIDNVVTLSREGSWVPVTPLSSRL